MSVNVFDIVADTAYGKNKEDSQWYYFDDSSVSNATEEACVVSSQSYLNKA